MNRRRFLTLLGVIPVAAAFPLPMFRALSRPTTAWFDGVLYRGDDGGRIFISSDDGLSWQLHTYLGPEYRVTGLAVNRANRLQATIDYAKRAFDLVLAPNTRSWVTI